ncbi:DUF4190 domain-containing protein [Streptomyces sp. ISL-98]|uniref:DUF4190 domain-containing protein n=1 Tax=Streptomyces sp. ISL-98 TaxID=2819192 RepID=UPI001BE916CC|nr:DUF4190 domain-containing protein [Streptomyces sp. ISL-98]MBT2511025.1 DUF4190 domain-containing protein [Streptomyces sp. ISL-98]
MTMPAPPSGQSPWGPTPAGFQGPPPQMTQPRNGLGVAALVLGIAGVVLGLAVFLFWMSWLPALLALVFGIIGLGNARKGLATNKGMALTGLILGAVGLLLAVGGGVFTVTKVTEITDDIRAEVESAEASAKASASAEASASAAAEAARNLEFGETYTYENGLKITVSKPQPYVPDDYVLGHAKGNKAVQVIVTAVNDGTAKVDFKTGLPNVSDADGADAELLIDGSGRQKVLTGNLLPGKRAVGKYAYSLPPGAADRIQVEFSPDVMEYDDAVWTGPVK